MIDFTQYSLAEKADIVAKQINQVTDNNSIKRLALSLGTPQRAYQYIHNNIRYRQEAKDILRGPQETLRLRKGDCEDLTLLMGAIARAQGHPVFIKIISDDKGNNHIYPLIKTGGKWKRFDLTPTKGLSNQDIQGTFDTVVSGKVCENGLSKPLGQVKDSDGFWTVFGVDIRKEMMTAVFTGVGVALGSYLFSKVKKQI